MGYECRKLDLKTLNRAAAGEMVSQHISSEICMAEDMSMSNDVQQILVSTTIGQSKKNDCR